MIPAAVAILFRLVTPRLLHYFAKNVNTLDKKRFASDQPSVTIQHKFGRLIAIEGIDGAGKSYQAARLAATIGALCVHQPSGLLAPFIRESITTGDLTPRQLAVLFAAARLWGEEEISTARSSGRHVVSDRYRASTLAYQIDSGQSHDENKIIAAIARTSIRPDLTIILDIDVDEAATRISSRGRDPFELDREKQISARVAYCEMSIRESDHILIPVGGMGRSEVAAKILTVVTRAGILDR